MKSALKFFEASVEQFKADGIYKEERIITTPQRSKIDTTQAKQVINMCTNNYLGFADNKDIIDGVRLCKANRYRYKNNDMQNLERCLKEATQAGSRIKLIATDGVFSMDGIVADLVGICELEDKYDDLVMVDDSHAIACFSQVKKAMGI